MENNSIFIVVKAYMKFKIQDDFSKKRVVEPPLYTGYVTVIEL